MRRRTLHSEHAVGRVNVTPMIDVVMVLIVFYLIVGKLASDRIEAVPLPVTSTGDEDPPPDPLVINVLPGEGGSAKIVVEMFEIELDTLERMVARRLADRPDVAVQIRADRSLRYGLVGPVLSACRAGGARSVVLSAEKGP